MRVNTALAPIDCPVLNLIRWSKCDQCYHPDATLRPILTQPFTEVDVAALNVSHEVVAPLEDDL